MIGYDGSEDAVNAIAGAGRLLSPRPALVVHSYVGLSRLLLRSDPPDLTGPLAEAVKELRADDADEADRVAAEGAQVAIGAGLDAQPLAVEQDGSAWRTLIATAEKHGAAAMVTGARGRSGLASVLLGSVSSGLVHHSPVPLLVVPAPGDAEAAGPALLCYDGSESSRRAITVSYGLLAPREALVLHLWEAWSQRAPGLAGLSGSVRGMVRELDEIADTQSGELVDAGAALARDTGFDVQALSRRCLHSVWKGVLEAADDRDASVVVLGSRGLSGISSALGSVSYGVVHHARRPVLVVPDTADRAPP